MTIQDPSGLKPQAAGGRHVVIAGGGLSGAALAFHLARESGGGGPRITVIEPREDLGRGLAYSTLDPDHRLNVPDHKMTLDTAAPEAFATWLRAGGIPVPDSRAANGDHFLPRAVFGAWVAEVLQPFLASGRIRHLRARAVGGRADGAGFLVATDTGEEIRADQLVLAATHPAPALPGELAAIDGHPALIADAYAPDALNRIAADERVLILGSGLTGADVVASLTRRDHRGPVHLLSRHGRRSQPHGPAQGETGADLSRDTPNSALALLRRIRAELAQDAARGLTWHALFDRLRAQGPVIWTALPLAERARLLRHLRGLWDIHRFRIAPQTHDIVEQSLSAEKLARITGRLRKASVGAGGVTLTVGHKGRGESRITVDRIVLATGPAHGAATRVNPLYADLARQGLIRADALRLGLDTDANGAAIGATGQADPALLVAGPLARAAVGELMGVPEVTAWAEKLARRLALPQGAEV